MAEARLGYVEMLSVLHGWIGQRVQLMVGSFDEPDRAVLYVTGILEAGETQEEEALIASKDSVLFGITVRGTLAATLVLDRTAFDHARELESGTIEIHNGHDDESFVVITIKEGNDG